MEGQIKREEESEQQSRRSKRENKGARERREGGRDSGNVLLPVEQRNIVVPSGKLAAARR